MTSRDSVGAGSQTGAGSPAEGSRHPLAGREAAVFSAVAEAIVGQELPSGALDSIAPFLRALRGADLLQLRLLLRALDLVSLPVARRRFAEAPVVRRQRILERWARSRIPARRQAVAALKGLSMIAFYGDEGSWEAVGYDGPWLNRVPVEVMPAPPLPVLPVLAAARRPGAGGGVLRGRDARGDLHLRADVCVIGTGAGGAAAFARLAEHGLSVLAVEGGPRSVAPEFDQREISMLPLLYEEAGLRSTSDKAIGILQGRGLGGSTLHNTGLVVPPPRGILGRWREEHAFPLPAVAFEPYLAEVVRALRGVPVPEAAINPNNQRIRRGAAELGWRHFIALHNRSTCSGCGYCMLGCAYNRKYNAALTFVPEGLQRGGRVLVEASAERIEGRRDRRRVVCALRGADGRETGHRAYIDAPVVVLAAGALGSPALLLRSGLGNRRVGEGLRLHPAPVVAAVFSEPIRAWRGVPQSVIVDEFASFYEDGRGGWLFLPSAANWPSLAAVVTPGLGPEHRARMLEHERVGAAAVLLHDEGTGRVGIDRGGRPVARYRLAGRDREELKRGIGALARLFLAAGAVDVRLPDGRAGNVRGEAELHREMRRLSLAPHRAAINSVHPQGGLVMAGSREGGAAGPFGEVWDEPGIFVADASLFPTSVGVPPQVTVMALARMVADRVAGRIG